MYKSVSTCIYRERRRFFCKEEKKNRRIRVAARKRRGREGRRGKRERESEKKITKEVYNVIPFL